MLTRVWVVVVALGAAALTGGCNTYGGLDSPSGNEQLLSAARACFDQGDFACAAKYYQQVSGSDLDVAASEEAFAALDQNGAGMASFTDFIGNVSDGVGKGLDKFSSHLYDGAGKSRRIAIWNAYHSATLITDTTLKSFTTFITGMALTAEIMAEASTGGILHTTDLATTPATCKALTGTACATAGSSCLPPTGSNLVDDASQAGDLKTVSPSNDKPTSQQLLTAINISYDALTTLAPNGKFSSTASVFNTITASTVPTTTPAGQCFRQLLLTQGIGE